MQNRRLPLIEFLLPDRSSKIWLGLSVLLALCIWAYTITEAKYTKELYVTLEFVNIPPGTVVLGRDAERSVVLLVQAPQDLLKHVNVDDALVQVDLEQAKEGPQIIDIRKDHVRLPSTVELVEIRPASVRVYLDKFVTARLPVRPAFTGEAGEEMVVTSWDVEPEDGEVRGPETILREIEHLSTSPVSLDHRTASFEERVYPASPDPEVEVTAGQTWTLHVRLGERRVQRSMIGVPITVMDGGKILRLTPETLKVGIEGPQSFVEAVRLRDFRAEVDARELTPSPTPYRLKPAVRYLGDDPDKSLEITSVIPRYIAVRVIDPDAPEEPPSLSPEPE